MNLEMLIEFIITYLDGPPTLRSYCVGFSWPASAPEIFLCAPGKWSMLIAAMGICFWYLCIREMIYGTTGSALKKVIEITPPEDGEIRWSLGDIIIRIRVELGIYMFYLAWVPLRIASWLLVIEPLEAMEIHTAYYRYAFDKEHGEGSGDFLCAFYDAYLQPDVESIDGIDWMR